MKKITKATFKSFVRKNSAELLVNKLSSFDGMVDCVMPQDAGFESPDASDWAINHSSNTLGIRQIWIVGGSNNWFTHYEDETHVGIKYSNCCGNGIVAIIK